MISFCRYFSTIIILSLIIQSAHAATIFVSPDSKKTNSGAEDAPLASIQQAVDMMKPGDTVQIKKGRYVEQVMVSQKEVHEEQPFTIQGEPGVELSNYVTRNPKWEPAGFGEGIYKTPIDYQPSFLSYNLNVSRNSRQISKVAKKQELPKGLGF